MIFKRKAMTQLKEWRETYAGKYAALLEGPRRVGKSTIAEQFALKEYKSYIKVDFANITDELLHAFSLIANLDVFFFQLQAITGITLYNRKSVIIFDEIQLQPKVRQAIKYLVKDGRYDYIETGSLLSIKKNVAGIVIPSEEYKIPVYPMDYEEFLWATGKNNYSFLREIFTSGKPVGQAVNRTFMYDYRIYMTVGGMPQAVEAYVEKLPLKEIDNIKRMIIDLYEQDFYKIDPSGRVSMMFNSIPAQLARNSKRYSIGFAINKKARTSDYELLSDLINSRTVLPCFNCLDPTVSFAQGKDLEKFKLYLSDTGLFVTLLLKAETETDTALYSKIMSDLLPANLGYLYENAVAQTLCASGRDLYYMTWPKENSTHAYEIDFLIRQKTKTIPIEVKSSRIENHQSIDAFISKYSSVVSSPYILSQKDLGKNGQIKLCPFYLSSFIFE
jgi:uncharacterized protein